MTSCETLHHATDARPGSEPGAPLLALRQRELATINARVVCQDGDRRMASNLRYKGIESN